MLKHLLGTMGLAVLLCWPGACPAQTDDPGPIRAGDRWSYESKDAATGDIRNIFTLVVAEITDKEISTRVSSRGKDRPRTVVFDLQWGIVDDGVVQYRPASVLDIRAPLKVGKEWRSETNAANMQTGNV